MSKVHVKCVCVFCLPCPFPMKYSASGLVLPRHWRAEFMKQVLPKLDNPHKPKRYFVCHDKISFGLLLHTHGPNDDERLFSWLCSKHTLRYPPPPVSLNNSIIYCTCISLIYLFITIATCTTTTNYMCVVAY